MNYISAAVVIIDGQELEDVKRVREGRRTLRRTIKVMKRRGKVKTTPDYTIELDTTIPEDGPGFDYESIENKTLTIEYDNGTRIIYTGVDVLEIGEEEFDDEREAIVKVLLAADERQVQ